jgi:hypothetical protein
MSRINWWITTAPLAHGGRRVLGPFRSRELTMEVRGLLEFKNNPTTYWIDHEGAQDGIPIPPNQPHEALPNESGLGGDKGPLPSITQKEAGE